VLQEIGQEAVTEKILGDRERLGREGPALLLAQAQALLGFFEEDLNGPFFWNCSKLRVFCCMI
jgi:hypothetical protein